MSKTKDQFINQMHEKVFKAWWQENEILFPLVHTSSAKKIFIAGREQMEKQYLKHRMDAQKAEKQRRALQGKLDRALKLNESK